MRKLRLLVIILLLLGLFAFIEGYFLKWIILDSQYSIFVYDSYHLHHWQLGIVLVVISVMVLIYEKTHWRKRSVTL